MHPTTLLLSHLPEKTCFNKQILQDFFEYHGAIQVRVPDPFKGKLKRTAFVQFPTMNKAMEMYLLLTTNHPFGKQVTVEIVSSQLISPLIMDRKQDEKSYYVYPPANTEILKNIMESLVKVPKLYIQLLHLMNKMNLPPPFMVNSSFCDELEKRMLIIDEWMSSDESELGDKMSENEEMEEIEDIKDIKEMNESELEDADVANFKNHSSTDLSSLPPPASYSNESSMKLSESEIKCLPHFRSYSIGDPSPVLYIKNLNEKKITQADLLRMFSPYENDLNIRLMTQGKMRGQAFIRFGSTEIAMKALEAVNGTVIYEKPMVISYGKK